MRTTTSSSWSTVGFAIIGGCVCISGGFALQACTGDDTSSGATGDAAAPMDGAIDATSIIPDSATSSDASIDVKPDVAPPFCNDAGVPNDLQCTGLYSDWATKTIATTAVSYTPAFILWSDGAAKARWIALPAGAKIDTTDMDDWVFPNQTKIWKEFTVGGKKIETRFMYKDESGTWNFAVYRWNSAGTAAPLLDSGEMNVNGTTYEVPSVNECASCHGGRVDAVLGFDLIGTGVAGAQGLTLAQLVSQNKLTNAPPATTVVIPEDATNKAAPALGWMHANCGTTCHNKNPNAQAMVTQLYLKLVSTQLYPDGGAATVASLDSYTTSVGVMSHLTPNGMHYQRIKLGDSSQSLIPLMDMSRDEDAGFKPMPPLVSHVADTVDVQLVKDWIDAL